MNADKRRFRMNQNSIVHLFRGHYTSPHVTYTQPAAALLTDLKQRGRNPHPDSSPDGSRSAWSRRAFCSLAMAASQPGFAAASNRIRVAVLGTGHAHAPGKIRALRSLPQFEFAGICRPDPDEPNQGEVFDGVRWLALEELLEDRSIELVAVESRVERGLGYAEQCVRASKYVHLDKPPGEDLARLRALLAEAGRRRRVVQMGYQWRYHPAIEAAVSAARQGWLGRVYAFRASIDKPIAAEERRRLAAFRGGMMFELGCHLIDRAVALLGKPKKVTGFLRHDSPLDDGLADNTLAILEYERAMAEIYVAAFQPHGGRYRQIEISGTNGKATVQPFSPLRLVVDLEDAAGPYRAGLQDVRLPEEGPAFAPDFLEMASVIRKGAAPRCSPEHDLITHEALLQACHVI
ncbi:MAG: Gfo/Idh/MocA family oxidoreductase [Acidobacteria bacterium]|nr:Gfo/Idh/MocA family oxidoreductase [Acidobacteriota bacterium]